jgi:hypothetical protein
VSLLFQRFRFRYRQFTRRIQRDLPSLSERHDSTGPIEALRRRLTKVSLMDNQRLEYE